jgi:hypothetical protein
MYQGTPTIKDENGNSLGTLPASIGDYVAFLIKFDSTGTYQYARTIDSSSSDQGYGVSCDSSGNVYFAGYYQGTPTIKDQTGASLGTLPASAGATTLFLCKFNSSGTYQYSRIIDSSGSDEGFGVACDSSGNVYLAGFYAGTPTIKDQNGNSLGTLPASSGTRAAVSSKFDSTGTYQYSRIVDAAGGDIGLGVACDSSRSMYFTGYYIGTPTIKDQTGASLGTLPISSQSAAFMCKFS